MSVQFTLLNRGSILFKLLCSSYLLHCLIFKIHYASPLLSGNSFILPHLVRFVKYFFQIPLSVLVRSLFVVPYYHITFASLCQVLFFAPCLPTLSRFDSFVILALPPPFRQPFSFLFYLLLIFFLSLLLFLSVSYNHSLIFSSPLSSPFTNFQKYCTIYLLSLFPLRARSSAG